MFKMPARQILPKGTPQFHYLPASDLCNRTAKSPLQASAQLLTHLDTDQKVFCYEMQQRGQSVGDEKLAA